jgi:hypothetical protein
VVRIFLHFLVQDLQNLCVVGARNDSTSSAVVIGGNYYNDDDDDGLGGRTTDEVGKREGEEEDWNLLLTWLLQEGYRIN